VPSVPIIDTHVHLMDPTALAYPWVAGVPALRRRHGLHEYEAARGTTEVEGIVVVEADAASGAAETRYLLDLAGRNPRIKGIVAHLKLEEGAALAPVMEELAANPIVKGLRRLIQDEPEPGFCLQPGFQAGVRAAGEAGLCVDLCVRHHQLGDLVQLVRNHPKTTFVLDHIAKPAIRDGLMEPWRRELRELALHENVWCKISGVATEADHVHWTPEQLVPYIETAWNAFGAGRVMFGSDWPVCLLAIDWIAWVDIMDGVLASFSESERQAYWARNAKACYGLSH
jgi:L-fuconolactonase